MVESQILAALKMGFTTADIRGLTVPEVLEFCDVAYPDENAPKAARKATQSDIDRLLG